MSGYPIAIERCWAAVKARKAWGMFSASPAPCGLTQVSFEIDIEPELAPEIELELGTPSLRFRANLDLSAYPRFLLRGSCLSPRFRRGLRGESKCSREAEA